MIRGFRFKRWRSLLVIASIPVWWFAWRMLLRPSSTALSRPLFGGVVYERRSETSPRPIMLHRVKIDLRAPGIRPLVTPGRPLLEVKARTTSEFLSEFNLQVASNASIFAPCYTNHPLDFYPHSGDPVSISGQVITDGVEYSPPEQGWTTLCFAADNRASIVEGACPEGTRWGVGTTNRLISAGVVAQFDLIGDKATEPHPRTAVGIDGSGYQLQLLVVDGRQPFYSEGMTLAELAEQLRRDGAVEAAAFDGGGSATLVVESAGEPQLLNSPIHSYIPLRERPVGTHLGFYATPLL